MVCVVLLQHIGFHRLIAAFSYAWVSRMAKRIQLSRDIKSNHDRQYLTNRSHIYYSHNIIINL